MTDANVAERLRNLFDSLQRDLAAAEARIASHEDALASITAAAIAAEERARQSELKYQSEYGINDRIWRLFGSPSYEELQGRTIYDLVEGEQKRADEAVAQQAAMEELIQRAPYDTRATAWGVDVKAAISSLSPRAKHLLAVVAANAKWQRIRRSSPMDHAGENKSWADLWHALDALHMEGAYDLRSVEGEG